MTYVEKHSGIAQAIRDGKSNEAIAKEFGVSHGMVQKHRSGETANQSVGADRREGKIGSSASGAVNSSADENFSGETRPARKTEAELLKESEIRRNVLSRFVASLRANEKCCGICSVMMELGVCPRCGRNKWRVPGMEKEFPGDDWPIEHPVEFSCPQCGKLCKNATCVDHGDFIETVLQIYVTGPRDSVSQMRFGG